LLFYTTNLCSLGSAFVPSLVYSRFLLQLLHDPFTACCINKNQSKNGLKISDTLGRFVLTRYPTKPSLISTLPLRSYRHLDHSTGPLISFSIFHLLHSVILCTIPHSLARRHAYGSHTHCTNQFHMINFSFEPPQHSSSSSVPRRFRWKNQDATLLIRIYVLSSHSHLQ